MLSFMSNTITKRLMRGQVRSYKKLPRGFLKDENWGSRVESYRQSHQRTGSEQRAANVQ